MSTKNFVSYGDAETLFTGVGAIASKVRLNTQDLTTPSRTKNLLPMTVDGIKAANARGTWSGNSCVKNGITFTVITDDDNNVTGISVQGTASANADFYIFGIYGSSTVLIQPGVYKATLNGIIQNIELHSGYMQQSFDNVTVSNPERTLDAQSGITYVVIRVINGSSISTPITIAPMIRLATETDATYAPYIPSVESRIEDLESGLDTVKSGLTNVNSNLTSLGLSVVNGKLCQTYSV